MAGELDVIVATNAFGMGVDKSDIRLVVHADIPRSPEAYYQEAGRGGRDGKPTRCVLLFNHGDIRLQEFLIDASYPSAELLRGLWKLLQTTTRARQAHGQRRGSRGAPQAAPARLSVGRGAVVGDPRSSSATACSRATTSGSPPSRPSPGQYPPLDVESLAAPRRGRAQQAAHDDRLRVLPALPPPVRARVLRRRRLGRRAIAAAARATTARRSRTARPPASPTTKPTAIRSAAHAGRRAERPVRSHAHRRARERQRRRRAVRRAARARLRCAAGRRSTSWICCARSKAPASSRRRAASTRRSRRRAKAIRSRSAASIPTTSACRCRRSRRKSRVRKRKH